MALETPMAKLPVRRDAFQLLAGQLIAQKLNVLGPNIITAAGIALRKKNGVAIRRIQNASTTAVLWKVGGAPTVNDYHGSLNPASIADNGDGGVQDLSAFKGDVYVAALSGNVRVVTFEALAPEAEAENPVEGA